jgi:hypothetical protein
MRACLCCSSFDTRRRRPARGLEAGGPAPGTKAREVQVVTVAEHAKESP